MLRPKPEGRGPKELFASIVFAFSRQFRWALTLTLLLVGMDLHGAESWLEVVARMPLGENIGELNRSNCLQALLGAFKSNEVAKALIFMPGASDEFYLFNPTRVEIKPAQPSLLDAIIALTNQTRIRVTFHAPMLLLHTDVDLLEPDILIHDQRTAERIRMIKALPHLYCTDRDWDFLQPVLKQFLRMDVRPWRGSVNSWHFYRHSFAGWGLSGWEGLKATALAGKTRVAVRRNSVLFELDR